MKRTTAALLIVAGAAVGVKVDHEYASRYSNESIWERQSTLLERHVRDPAARKQKLEELRTGLKGLDENSREDRCIYESRFEAVVAHNGNVSAAEADLVTKSFEPNAGCKSGPQLEKVLYSYPAIFSTLAFVAGLFGMIGSFGGNKRGAS